MRKTARMMGWVAGLAMLALATPASAQYMRTIESDVDPGLFRIDETKHLGAKLDSRFSVIDETGAEKSLGAIQAGRPLILVLSYYSCDGSCSLVNNDLRQLLAEAKSLAPGKDYAVLTLSFDKNDTVETLANFKKQLEVPEHILPHWAFGLPSDMDALKALADQAGFKFFWSPRDRTFLHPGIFVVLTPEGRIARFLYSLSTRPKDIELAITEALENRITVADALKYAVSLCYSYNYAEGRYTYNIPLFVSAGSLALGVLIFTIAMTAYNRRRKREALR